MSKEKIIRLEDISVKIANAQVLDNISLHVNVGETVALIGRNGAGKTTTFRTIMGRTDIINGKVYHKDTDITNQPSRERISRGIGFAPEDRRLFTTLSVEDNLRLPTWGEKISEEKFQEQLDQVTDSFPEITDFLDRPAGQLSGGQQKMVTVGRAMTSDPEIILIDEPFEGLAPSVRERFREGIERIKDLGISIMIAESNVRHAAEVLDRAYVVERGNVVAEINEDEEVVSNPEVRRIFEGDEETVTQ